MAFPLNLTATLTGASIKQLRRWSASGLLKPEAHEHRPMMYSFRDLIALRSIVYLRRETSLQRVRKALANLDVIDLTEHPSSYRFFTDGRSIAVGDPNEDDVVVDLVKERGQTTDLTLAAVYDRFETKAGRVVESFLKPKPRLEVNPRRMGGWPTIQGTRITYDTLADLVDDETIRIEDVPKYYPVSIQDVREALDFAHKVKSADRRAG